MASSPEWTDANQSDPGISLLELVAFLATGHLLMISLESILVRTGLVRRTVTVVVDGEPWTQIETLDAGPDARVFRVDPATGSIQFGDGVKGKVPSGSVIITSSNRYGVGAAGAVGAIAVGCTLWAISIWGRWRRRRPSGSP